MGTDGDWRIDYVCGAGALVLGHAYPEVVTAVRDQASIGTHFFGLVNDKALELAEELVSAIPCADRVIFTTTGSEATYYAMRFARAFTGRDVILKLRADITAIMIIRILALHRMQLPIIRRDNPTPWAFRMVRRIRSL